MIKSPVFIDTNAFVSLANVKDEHHQEAKAITQDLVSVYRKPHITTDYVLDETYTFLRYRLGHRVAVAFGESIQEGTDIHVVMLGQEILDRAWEMFKRYKDKDFSFTDCTSFVVMRERKMKTAFTFDKHFEQAGFEIVRT